MWKDFKIKLNDLKEGENISFDEMLTNLGVPEQCYVLAVRSSINHPTVFLKRSPNELRVNNYNPACLKAWRANSDIQFVLDVYARPPCVEHVTLAGWAAWYDSCNQKPYNKRTSQVA